MKPWTPPRHAQSDRFGRLPGSKSVDFARARRNKHRNTKPGTPQGPRAHSRDFLKFSAQSARARMGNVRIVEISTEITKVLRPGTKQIAQSRSSSHSDARKRPKRLRCGPPRAGQCIDHCGSRRYTLRDFAGKPRQGRQRAHLSERGGAGSMVSF